MTDEEQQAVFANEIERQMQIRIDQDRYKIDKLKTAIDELWSLWESMAEAGELKIGPQFSTNYERLKQLVNELNHL